MHVFSSIQFVTGSSCSAQRDIASDKVWPELANQLERSSCTFHSYFGASTLFHVACSAPITRAPTLKAVATSPAPSPVFDSPSGPAGRTETSRKLEISPWRPPGDCAGRPVSDQDDTALLRLRRIRSIPRRARWRGRQSNKCMSNFNYWARVPRFISLFGRKRCIYKLLLRLNVRLTHTPFLHF